MNTIEHVRARLNAAGIYQLIEDSSAQNISPQESDVQSIEERVRPEITK